MIAMRLTTLIFSSLICLSALCQVSIRFDVKNLPDSVVYIGYHFGHQKYVLDTVPVQSGKFRFEAASVKPGLYFVYAPDYYLEFVMHEGSFGLSTTYEGGYKTLDIRDSRENELFKEFQLQLGALQTEQRQLLEQVKQKDSVAAMSRLKAIDQEMDAFRQRMKASHPESFTVAFFGLMQDVEVPEMKEVEDEVERNRQRYLYYRNHFFDGIDLSDASLLRTPLLHQKVTKYMDQVIFQHPDSIIVAVDWLFTQLPSDPESYRYWLVTLFKKYTESKVMGMDAVMVHMIENYYLTPQADWVTEEYEKKLREEVAFVKPNLIGTQAPELNVVDTLMQPFYLRQIASPYTLLFIYDPDCGHCKATIKELEEEEIVLQNLDIQVLAVCSITDVQRWKEFVSGSNPLWIHAIDPTGQSNFKVYYNVRSTPKLYLLDQSKRIIAKQLEIDQIVDLVNNRNALR